MSNIIQKFILFVASAVVLLMMLFPPFVVESQHLNMGYHFILNPPEIQNGYSPATVNDSLLLAQWMGVLLITAFLYLAYNDKE